MSKSYKNQLAILFGSRMRDSREFAGLGQQKAAELLGYASSSYLSKIETATDTNREIDVELAIKAADLYEVSLDYLLGRVNEIQVKKPFEVNAIKIKSWLHEQNENRHAHELSLIMNVAKRIELLEKFITTFHREADKNLSAVNSFVAANKELHESVWAESKSGNRLVLNAQEVLGVAKTAQREFALFCGQLSNDKSPITRRDVDMVELYGKAE